MILLLMQWLAIVVNILAMNNLAIFGVSICRHFYLDKLFDEPKLNPTQMFLSLDRIEHDCIWELKTIT